MGTSENYLQLNQDLLNGKSTQYATDKDVIIGERSNIHPTAQIEGTAMIGANCTIGPGVKLTGPVVIGDGGTISDESSVEKSVIWKNARLGPRARIKDSVLADNCQLMEGSLCHRSVLGDNVTVSSNVRLKPGSKIGPGTVVEAR